MKYRLATDVGNSTSKNIIFSYATGKKMAMRLKSVIAPVLVLPTFSEDDEAQAVANLINNLVVHIVSPSVPVGLYAVDEKAIKTPNNRNMNIRTGSKHKHDIPVVMPLATIAAKAVQDHYASEQTLPDELDVTVNYSSAIPAREFTPEIARALEARLKGNHIVTVYATSKPVKVNVSIEGVKVTQEGIPATYAIVEGSDALLTEYRKKYDAITVNKDYAKKKLLLVDIGDGTTEFVYVANGKPDTDLSDGDRLGVGHAATSAKKLFDELTKTNINMNRQQYMDAVLDSTHHYHKDAKHALEMANIQQAQAIAEFVQDMFLDKLAGNVDEIVVLGGGSATFKNSLQQLLYDFAEEVGSKILWIPEKFAPNLNAIGLDILNEKLFYRGE